MERIPFMLAIILFGAVIAQAEPVALVIPKPLVIPSEPAESSQPIRIVFPQSVGAAASAACPMDASVVVRVLENKRVSYSASGTVIQSSERESLILTSWHLIRGVDKPAFAVEHDGVKYEAGLVKTDEKADLMLLRVSAKLPSVAVAESPAVDGDAVVSIGLVEDGLTEFDHKVIDALGDPLRASGDQIVGRSGGGLFLNGELIGVTKGRSPDGKSSLYVPGSVVRSFVPQAFGSASGPVVWGKSYKAAYDAIEETGKPLFVFVTASWCGPCQSMKTKTFKESESVLQDFTCVEVDGDASQELRRDLGVTSYPSMFIISTDRKIVHRFVGYRTASALGQELSAFARPVMESASVGQITGGAVIESVLASMFSVAGDGATASFTWRRSGAKPALLVGQSHGLIDICGTSGRIELVVTSAAKLPVKKIAFNYWLTQDGDRIRKEIAIDRTEVEFPDDGVVGSAPVGDPFTVAWSIISVIETIHTILTPTVDVWLGDEIRATATLTDGKLAIDLGANPPAVRLHWRFLYGLLNAEYSRALTGVVIGADKAVVQFHRSRIYRDVTLPFTK